MTLRHLMRALAAIAIATPAAAQRPGTVDIGAFGRYARFSDTLGFSNNKFGFGGGIGLFVAQNLALEADGSWVNTTTRSATPVALRYLPVHARLAYHAPVSEHAALILGLGYARNFYGKIVTLSGGQHHDDGVGALFGIRADLSDHVGIRVDGALDYLLNSTLSTAKFWNFGVHAGLSLRLNNGSSKKDKGDDAPAPRPAAPAKPATPAPAAAAATPVTPAPAPPPAPAAAPTPPPTPAPVKPAEPAPVPAAAPVAPVPAPQAAPTPEANSAAAPTPAPVAPKPAPVPAPTPAPTVAPKPAPAPTVTTKVPAPTSGRPWRVQLAATTAPEAAKLIASAKAKGIEADTFQEGGYVKVRTGRYATRAEAVKAMAGIKSTLGGSAFVVRQP